MAFVFRSIIRCALYASLVACLQISQANAGCLPGQTCWQVPQLQNARMTPPPDHSAQQRVLDDRARVIQNQQQITSDRTKLLMPPATRTPLDRANLRQDLRTDRDQLLQSQQSLQRSQLLLQEQSRPPSPTPYVVKPAGTLP